jgi:hypothetical protein
MPFFAQNRELGYPACSSKEIGKPEAGRAVSPSLRYFLLSLSLQPCYNPIEIQFKPPRRFPGKSMK